MAFEIKRFFSTFLTWPHLYVNAQANHLGKKERWLYRVCWCDDELFQLQWEWATLLLTDHSLRMSIAYLHKQACRSWRVWTLQVIGYYIVLFTLLLLMNSFGPFCLVVGFTLFSSTIWFCCCFSLSFKDWFRKQKMSMMAWPW